MQLFLEFRSGPAAAPRIWLLEGQTASVGRTESADFCVPGDLQMSSVHFSLSCGSQRCMLRDLGSTNGTRLNGALVREALLRTGDIIRAGQTEFTVRMPDKPTTDDARAPGRSSSPTESDVRSVVAPASAPPPPRPEAAVQPSDPRRTDPEAPLVSAVPTGAGGWLCLEVQGRTKPERIWLKAGQSASVGNSAWADYCVSGDGAMAPQHFLLTCDSKGSRLRSLNESATTLVNGQAVHEHVLRHGDVITAGMTHFVVQIRQDATMVDAAARRPFESIARGANALWLKGVEPLPSRDDLLTLLGETRPVRLLVNCNILECPLPANPVFLLNWLPATVIARLSPVVICPARIEEAREWLDRAWGKDALVTLFSQLETSDFVRRLRLLARGHRHERGVPNPDLMLASSAPSDWRHRFETAPIDYVDFALQGLDAILLEPRPPAHWEVLASRATAEWLEGAVKKQGPNAK